MVNSNSSFLPFDTDDQIFPLENFAHAKSGQMLFFPLDSCQVFSLSSFPQSLVIKVPQQLATNYFRFPSEITSYIPDCL